MRNTQGIGSVITSMDAAHEFHWLTASVKILKALKPVRGVNLQKEIKRLTGVKLSAHEAVAEWELVQDHKWYLSERLGRDVGLHVAAVDYFVNVRRRLEAPPQRFGSNNLPSALPMMRPLR